MLSRTAAPSLEITRRDNQMIVQVSGCDCLNEASAEFLGGQLDRLAAETEGTHLLLDLNGIAGMTSVGLGKLIGLHLRLRASGGRLTLLNVRSLVRTALAASHLDRLLEVVE